MRRNLFSLGLSRAAAIVFILVLSQPGQATDLTLFKNYFGTIDDASKGIGLRATGRLDLVTGEDRTKILGRMVPEPDLQPRWHVDDAPRQEVILSFRITRLSDAIDFVTCPCHHRDVSDQTVVPGFISMRGLLSPPQESRLNAPKGCYMLSFRLCEQGKGTDECHKIFTARKQKNRKYVF